MPSLSDYDVLETLGSGTYGTCSKIKRKRDGKTCVWKEICYSNMSENEKMKVVTEVNILRELNHKNIVRYYERVVDQKSQIIYIIMEYCEGGDLASLIKTTKKEGRSIEEAYVWKVCHQIASAMAAFQQPTDKRRVVLHRDLKPANLFLDLDFNIKVGDFGLARTLNHDSSLASTLVGTPYYMSPEQVKNERCDEKCDVWSLGCILYEMAALRPPFLGRNHLELANKITAGQFARIPNKYSDDLFHLISSMLNIKKEERPSINGILKKTEFTNNSKALEKVDVFRRESHLGAKEERLRKREKALAISERRLLARERQLESREKAADDRLAKAEKLIAMYKNKVNCKCTDENHGNAQPSKKFVGIGNCSDCNQTEKGANGSVATFTPRSRPLSSMNANEKDGAKERVTISPILKSSF